MVSVVIMLGVVVIGVGALLLYYGRKAARDARHGIAPRSRRQSTYDAGGAVGFWAGSSDGGWGGGGHDGGSCGGSDSGGGGGDSGGSC